MTYGAECTLCGVWGWCECNTKRENLRCYNCGNVPAGKLLLPDEEPCTCEDTAVTRPVSA